MNYDKELENLKKKLDQLIKDKTRVCSDEDCLKDHLHEQRSKEKNVRSEIKHVEEILVDLKNKLLDIDLEKDNIQKTIIDQSYNIQNLDQEISVSKEEIMKLEEIKIQKDYSSENKNVKNIWIRKNRVKDGSVKKVKNYLARVPVPSDWNGDRITIDYNKKSGDCSGNIGEKSIPHKYIDQIHLHFRSKAKKLSYKNNDPNQNVSVVLNKMV